MSRTSRVPYHQNVYDLLQIEPGESPEAARLIEAHEAQHGPLPASVKEWYLVPNVVPLGPDESTDPGDLVQSLNHILALEGTLWHEYTEAHFPLPLRAVLEDFARVVRGEEPPHVLVLIDHLGSTAWRVEANGSDTPPVRTDLLSRGETDWWDRTERFADFVWEWVAQAYALGSTPRSRNSTDARRRGAALFTKPYANGLWLRAASEPFHLPVIDFLTDHFGDPERTSRPGNVTTYTFRPAGGTLRVTADEPAVTGGLSAWWVHADTSARLAEFAALLVPWGTLHGTLRADTDPAREVLQRVRG